MKILNEIINLFKGGVHAGRTEDLYLEGLYVSKKIAEFGEYRTRRHELEA